VPTAARSRIYQVGVTCLFPAVTWWGRLEVSGAETLPLTGPVLLVANHDSAWDPLVIGVAALRRRQFHALARSSLWRGPLGWAMTRMGQIPVDRENGATGVVDLAIEHLRAGAAVGLFPEGTVSRGRTLPVRSGAGRMALAVPEAQLVCAAVSGTVGFSRFPRRPRVRVEFFRPASGPARPDEPAADLVARLVAETRAISPPPPLARHDP
jgi:1-acyl-sn-glycerol-3-phosphate acyltransferase